MLDDILNAIPHGVMILDASLLVRNINSRLQEMTGYSAGEACGIGAEFILRSSIGAGSSLAGQVLEDGEMVCRNGTLLNRRRISQWVQFTLSRVSSIDGGAEDNPGLVVVVEKAERSESGGGGRSSSTLVGQSPQMQDVFERMAILARTDASVLITGETGSGKDRIAEELHEASARAGRAFIKVNCGALPEALLESELFGHRRGAFTGAVKDHPGMFRLADHGTLFLTEIGDLSLSLQVKLLSVLDDSRFYPVGSSSAVTVDVRLIAATHRDLRREVAEGRFREDLFFRLNVLQLRVPPLRERAGDVRLLLDHFLRNSVRLNHSPVEGFDSEAMRRLVGYRWPGNVRELRNTVEYGVNMCRGTRIGCGDLPDYLFQPLEVRGAGASVGPPPVVLPALAPVTPATGWAELEQQRILNALQQAGGRRGRAAELLGMGRTTLWRKIKDYNLE